MRKDVGKTTLYEWNHEGTMGQFLHFLHVYNVIWTSAVYRDLHWTSLFYFFVVYFLCYKIQKLKYLNYKKNTHTKKKTLLDNPWRQLRTFFPHFRTKMVWCQAWKCILETNVPAFLKVQTVRKHQGEKKKDKRDTKHPRAAGRLGIPLLSLMQPPLSYTHKHKVHVIQCSMHLLLPSQAWAKHSSTVSHVWPASDHCKATVPYHLWLQLW